MSCQKLYDLQLPVVSTPTQILEIYVLLIAIFFFLTHDETRKLSNIYKVKLYNPEQDITVVCSNVKGTEIHFHEGLLYFTGNSRPLSIAVINKKSDPTLNINRIKSNFSAYADTKFGNQWYFKMFKI